jgi:hypothetical protein
LETAKLIKSAASDASFAVRLAFAIQLHGILGGGNRCSGWRTLRGTSAVLVYPTLWQRKSERDAEDRMLSGVLQAIATEVELFKVKFLDSFELVFREPDPQMPAAHLPKVASLTQNLSTVFDSNAVVLGRIPDAALRRKTVATYLKLKAMVDVVNHYAAQRDSWESIRYQPSPGGGINERRAEVETWAERIRRNVPELESEIIDLLADIGKYLEHRYSGRRG